MADRGLLSLDNIEELAKLTLPGGKPLEFVLAVPGRRYGDFTEILEPIQARAREAVTEIIEETRWEGHRLVVAHNPERALEQTALRRKRVAALEVRAAQLAGKLDGQDAGEVRRGRKLSDSGAKARCKRPIRDVY